MSRIVLSLSTFPLNFLPSLFFFVGSDKYSQCSNWLLRQVEFKRVVHVVPPRASHKAVVLDEFNLKPEAWMAL